MAGILSGGQPTGPKPVSSRMRPGEPEFRCWEATRKGQLQLVEPVGAPALMERQGDRHLRPLDQSLPVGQKAIDQPREARRGGVQGGANGIGGHLLQLIGDDGGEQGTPPVWMPRLGGSSVVPMALDDAVPASRLNSGRSEARMGKVTPAPNPRCNHWSHHTTVNSSDPMALNARQRRTDLQSGVDQSLISEPSGGLHTTIPAILPTA